jgi:hypothetical protein
MSRSPHRQTLAFLRHVCCLLAVLLSGAHWPSPAFAQAADRAGRIDEIVASASRAGFPLLLGDTLAMTLRYGVHEELVRIGRSSQLGADWKPGNPWYRRAAEAADRASEELGREVAAHPPDWQAPLRAALDAVKDADLDGLVQLYRSPAAPVMLALADAGTSLYILASLETQHKSLGLRGDALSAMRRLSERIGELGATLDADQRAALVQHAPKQALKTMAVVHEELFRNTMRTLQPALDDARARLRAELAPLLEQFDPLRPPPAD